MRLASLLLIFLHLSLWSQIPDNRRIDWSKSGNYGHLTVDQGYSTLDLQPYLKQYDLDDAIGLALSDHPGEKLILVLPEGSFTANNSIILRSHTVLRGQGSDKTTVKLKLNGSGHGIQASGKDFIQKTSMTRWDSLGGYTIYVSNHTLNPGDWIRISEDNDERIESDWANGWIGQIACVESVNGSAITLNTPLTINYQQKNAPRINLIKPVEGVGVEDLSIIRYDETTTQTANIYFRYAVESWITGVSSDHANFSHVTLSRSANNLITGCYFQDAFDFGGGGKAYGVAMQFAASANRVTNNVFRKLRHSILLQACSNGNVIGYNYSREPYWTGVMSPSGTAGDLVLHGNYVFTNLFEGNVAQNLVIDDSHGINGQFNTFFRNRLEHVGIFMNPGTPSPGQNFLANEITGSGTETYMFIEFELGIYSTAGGNHLEVWNTNGEKVWGSQPDSLPASLYLNQAPPFWDRQEFPAIGGRVEFDTHLIPAQRRWESDNPAVSGGEIRSRSLFQFGNTTAELNGNQVNLGVQLVHSEKGGTLKLQTWKQTHFDVEDSVLMDEPLQDSASVEVVNYFEGYVPIYRWEYQIGQFIAHTPLFTLRKQDGKTIVSEPSQKELSIKVNERTLHQFERFMVIALNGQILREGSYDPGRETDELQNLPTGVYWIKRLSSDGFAEIIKRIQVGY